MVYAQPRICPREWDAQIPLEFWDTNRSPNLGKKTRPSNNKKKRTWQIVDFAILADHWVKLKENENKDKYLDLARELKKLRNMKVMEIPIVISFWYSYQRTNTGTGGLGNQRMRGDHSNYSIIKTGQNTEKSPGDLRRLAVIQTSVENHQLRLEWKTFKSVWY